MRHLPKICLFLLLLLFAQCGGLSNLATPGTTGTGSDLSSVETDLYEDGPVDIPVTIAKLDSADADLITIEFQESGISQNLQFYSSLKMASTGSGYVITGEAGAVNTEQATKIYGLNTETGVSVISVVKTDGSFQFSIPASEGDVIAIAPMVEDESQIAPPLFGDSENGVQTIAMTNSDSLNTAQNVVIDSSGYVYFSAKKDDGTFAIYRRNLDGTSVETIAENITQQIRFLSVGDNGEVTYITQDGKVFTVDMAASTSLNSQGVIKYAVTWNDPVQIYDFQDSLDPETSFIPPGAHSFKSSEGDVFIINKNPIRAGEDAVMQDSLITYVDKVTLEQTELLRTSDFEDIVADVGSKDRLYVFVKPRPGGSEEVIFKLYRLNMLDGAQAWENRVLIYSHLQGYIINMDVSVNDFIVFVSANGQGIHEFFTMDETRPPALMATVETDENAEKVYLEWLVVSPNSETGNARVVTCAQLNSTNQSYLVIHRIGQDEPNTFYRITNTETRNACAGSYRIDDQGRIVFYRTIIENGVEADPQLAFIDIDKIDESQITLDE